MDTDVTDVSESGPDESGPAPVPWTRRPATIIGGIAVAAVLALIGGLLWAFSGDKREPDTALKPIVPSAPPEPAESAESPLDEEGGLDLLGGLGGSAMSGSGGDLSSADSSMLSSSGGYSLPSGGTPSVALPTFEPPPASAFQVPPSQDWAALLQPFVQAQQEAAAANLGGAIAGPVVGGAWGTFNSAAIILSDLILFAAASPNGGALLNQLDAALSGLAVPAAAAGLVAPDFTGLSTAFAAAAGTPPIGVPNLPPLPALPPGLPAPEQVLGGLAALPAPQLPPPPPIGLPTPEQVAAGLFVLPAIGLPALPPPPPIGLPALPPPPPIGLPTIGFPSIGLPSITRLLGLPF